MAHTKATPGPWNAELIGYSQGLDALVEVWSTDGKRRRLVCQTIVREIASEGAELDKDQANCRLIASSPKMYDALKAIAIALAEPAGGEYHTARALANEWGIFNDDLEGGRVLLRLAEHAIKLAEQG